MFEAPPDPIPAVRTALASIVYGVGSPILIGGSHLQPLTVPDDEVGPAILHITDALEARLVVVEELARPDVAQLLFRHTGGISGAAVFVPAGTLVRGGGQNRIVSLSTMLHAGDSRPLEVRCVEVGRWNPMRNREFTGTGATPHSLKSRKMSRDLHARMRVTGHRSEDQGETWADVARHLDRVAMQSATGSLFDALDRSPAAPVVLPNALAGAAGAWFDGVASGAEVFLSPSLRRTGVKALVESAVSDGESTEGPRATFADVREDLLSSRAWRATAVPGGTIVDFKGDRSGAVGSAFVADGRVIHLVLGIP